MQYLVTGIKPLKTLNTKFGNRQMTNTRERSFRAIERLAESRHEAERFMHELLGLGCDSATWDLLP